VLEYPKGSRTPIVFTNGPYYPASTAVDTNGNIWCSGFASDGGTRVTGYWPSTGGAFVPVTVHGGEINTDDSGNLFVLYTLGLKKGTIWVYPAGSTTPSNTIYVVNNKATWLPEMAINRSEDRIYAASSVGINIIEYPTGTRIGTINPSGGYNTVAVLRAMWEI
jgi:hypothetical protein